MDANNNKGGYKSMRKNLNQQGNFVTRKNEEKEVYKATSNPYLTADPPRMRVKETDDMDGVVQQFVKEMEIGNISDASKMAVSSPAPVFYNGLTNDVVQVTNPYCSVIQDVINTGYMVATSSLMDEPYKGADQAQNPRNEILSDIRINVEDTIEGAYTNAIQNAVISYLQANLIPAIRDYFQFTNTDGIIANFAADYNIEASVSALIANTERLIYQRKKGFITIEQFNGMIYYHVCTARDRIMVTVANDMNEFIRTYAFGKSFVSRPASKRTTINGPSYRQRENASKMFHEYAEEQSGRVLETMSPEFEWFFSLSHECRVQIEVMRPMIEALLWQVTTAVGNMMPCVVLDTIFDNVEF
jgi:hypothetical protein